MRFQVPQFTEVEDKIIGPLTFKQFVYLAGSAGAIVVLFTFLPMFIAVIFAVPLGILGVMLAFYRVNNQPFIRVVEAYVKYAMTSKLYLWKHEEKKNVEQNKKTVNPNLVPKLSESKLRDLMWTLNVKQSQNPVTGDSEEEGNV
jgi:hypothetical protein